MLVDCPLQPLILCLSLPRLGDGGQIAVLLRNTLVLPLLINLT